MNTKRKLLPYALTLLLAVADQLIKSLVVRRIPLNTIGAYLLGDDFLRIIHVRNNAIAFSLGTGFPDIVRKILFIAVPVIIIAYIIYYTLRTDDFNGFQRWLIAGAVGGGLGNLIDRIFRNGLVIDYVDVKFYGIFGWERFPTFNLADSSIVVCGILLMLSFIVSLRGKHE